MIQKFEDFVKESRFVDLINKKFTGEQRKEDIPILYYDDGDTLYYKEIKCKPYRDVEIKIFTNGVTIMLYLVFPLEILSFYGKAECMLNDRTGKRIKYNRIKYNRDLQGYCSVFRHMYGGNKRNRDNNHQYTFDEINKDAHAAIDNIIKKECDKMKIDDTLVTATTLAKSFKHLSLF